MVNILDLKKYEGYNKGKPHTGIYDDLRIIVSNLCNKIYNNEFSSINYLIEEYKKYPFITNIKIDGNNCVITGKYNFSFNVISKGFMNAFCNDVFNVDDVNGKCHYIVQKVLEDCHNEYICAVTSLCVNVNYMFYFHSYIYDKSQNNVIDFSKKIIINKEIYDRLFCYKEINVLNYGDYSRELINSQYNDNSKVLPLFYLALDKLQKDEPKKIRK